MKNQKQYPVVLFLFMIFNLILYNVRFHFLIRQNLVMV